jgi:hypothetical protein
MSGLSPDGQTVVLAVLTSNAFASLHSADPGANGANELSGNGYARPGPNLYETIGADPTVASNVDTVGFPPALVDWGTPTYVGNWDAATGGTFRGSGPIAVPKPIKAGDVAQFSPGTLTITSR